MFVGSHCPFKGDKYANSVQGGAFVCWRRTPRPRLVSTLEEDVPHVVSDFTRPCAQFRLWKEDGSLSSEAGLGVGQNRPVVTRTVPAQGTRVLGTPTGLGLPS